MGRLIKIVDTKLKKIKRRRRVAVYPSIWIDQFLVNSEKGIRK